MNRRIIILLGLVLLGQLTWAQVNEPQQDTTVVLDEYDHLFLDQKEAKIGTNKANNDSLDVSKYLLEGRHRFFGDKFSKRLADHMYVSLGIGVKRIIPMRGGLGLHPLTEINLAVAKQFDKYNTLRVGFEYATGYQQGEYNNNMASQLTQLGLHVDYLFDWSAYTRGYNPTRFFSLSTILGLDGNVNFFKTTGTRWGYGGRFGLQLRFYTGNRSFVDVEPYVGIASDNMRLNLGTAAWRRVEFMYGVNVNLAFYLHDITQDKQAATKWRAPFFFEYGVGPLFNFGSGESWSNTVGHVSQLSIGKWLAPAIGLRISYSISQHQWGGKTGADVRSHSYETTYHTMHSGFGFEAMINPLGFKKNYDYNQTAGFHLVVGAGGIGWLNKYTDKNQTSITTTVTAGIHVWKKLTDDVQFFVEPKYIYRNYHKEYLETSDEGEVFSQHSMSLAMGVTVLSRPYKYRKDLRKEMPAITAADLEKKDSATLVQEYKDRMDRLYKVHHWRVGLGFGMPLSIDKFSYDEGYNGFGWCAQAYGVYDFTHIHGIRLAVDFTAHNHYTISRNSIEGITDLQPGEERQLNTRNLAGSMLGLSYNVNLTNAMCGYLPTRRWHVDLFAGPAVSMSFLTKAFVSPNPKAEGETKTTFSTRHENHVNFHPGGLIGMSLLFDCTKHIGVYLSPTFYILSESDDLKGSSINGLHLTQNINVGVQYTF